MKKLLILILILLIPQAGQSALRTGDSAPNFFLTDINGKPVQLYQIKGRVIVIEFLSNKCFACDYVIPDINKLYEKFKNKNVQIVGVIFNDEIEEPQKLNEFAKSRGIQYPLFIADVKVKKFYNIYGFPNFFILNEKKNIMKIYRGITQDTFGLFNKEIEKLLLNRR
ncbi:MAG: peroxiredoxin family protein [Thermodesulfovibrio sp.]|uniref:peroxiredoxin family protein n=1 Tax=Thermodesulfovibrio sp. TaxID=2067987 RepID=UPI003C7D26FB